MKTLDDALLAFLASPVNVVGAGLAALLVVIVFLLLDQAFFYLRFIAKSLLRNTLRTTLTFLATLMLVAVITGMWTILFVLDQVTSEKSKDLKAIVTERWQIPSQMPYAYEAALSKGGATGDDVKVQDSMSWTFYGGTLDPAKRTRDNIVFFFGMKPNKLINAVGLPAEDHSRLTALKEERRRLVQAGGGPRLSQWETLAAKGQLLAQLEARQAQNEKELAKLTEPIVNTLLQMGQPSQTDLSRVADFLARNCSYTSMMDGLEELNDQQRMELYLACLVMEKDKRKVILGKDRLKAINKRVGESFTVTSLNYPGVDLEVQILGQFPEGRYDNSALVNRDYILDGMDAWKQKNGKPHPMAEKALNLMWLRVPDTETFREVAEEITSSPLFKSPAVKCETASSGVASFLDAYRGLLWGMRYVLVPAILITMSLVIANAISISVRERRTEMAVLKVLGFGPWQILILILGEALLVGCAAGLVSAGGMWWFVNQYLGGLKFPIAFFPAFKVPNQALLWGPMLGGLTAFAGSVFPAWSARSVKVSEVFSKIS